MLRKEVDLGSFVSRDGTVPIRGLLSGKSYNDAIPLNTSLYDLASD